MMRADVPRVVRLAVYALLLAPAFYQLGLLVTAIHGRFGYPYDLEWMEGGLLQHAQRIRDGAGIYVPPSVDFIPYLYTPLYPSLIALFGGAFGVTYAVGRAISIVSLLGIALTAALQIPGHRHQHPRQGPAWIGVTLGLGLFAAAYPISDGWYDLVRADTLFLLLVTTGLGALPRWCRTGEGLAGHGRVVASATILTLAFFCKQTGIIYVALGGCMVLALAPRRLPAFVLAAAVLGLGVSALLQRSSNGWFWTYVFEGHRAHDFDMGRFWSSFGNILWRTENHGQRFALLGGPITIVVGVTLLAVAFTWWRRRVLLPQVRPLLIWSAVFAVSVLVGALGWATEFAVFNAYMPAQLHGALAAGAAVPAAFALARYWWGERPRGELVALGGAVAVALPLAITCVTARWSPSKFIPTSADVAAGDRLIARLRTIEGEIWIPSHPWYAYMAGKTPRVHRMGIVDVTAREPRRTVEGLDAALANHRFTAIVLDNRDLHNAFPYQPLLRYYRPALTLPRADGPCGRSFVCRTARGLAHDERPRVYTGNLVTPDAIWVPAVSATPPPGARALFDFETATWAGWKRSGPAWGDGPVDAAQPGQDLVLGSTGRRFGTSMTGGDRLTGRVTSPLFALNASRLSLRLGGGTDATKLRVELVVDDVPVGDVAVPLPGGDTLKVVTIAIPEAVRTKIGKLVLVDESATGHLDIDDVWAWE
jgi:hypothetical protein